MYPYRRIRISKTKTKDEHRIVMEQKLGRELTSNEIVHHKNESKKDNDPDNLEVMTRAEHSKLHFPNGYTINEITKKRFSEMYKGKPNFHAAKYTKDQIRQWYNLKQNGIGVREISRITGVSHTTIISILAGKYLAYKDILNEIRKPA